MTRLCCFLFFVMLVSLSFRAPAPTTYPQDLFIPPVKGQMLLSGTFGELRPNHFHGGIDIKGGIGVPLYAVAEGYVSRIKISAGGYGQALYINHPSGYTSVYGHMDELAPELAEYVRSEQYARQQFALDLKLEPEQFVFAQGEQVGTMGTKGRSFGPHLHFEIRETTTQRPINPLLFGLEVKDTRAPRINELRVYELNHQRETERARSFNTVSKGRGYGVSGDTIRVGSPYLGLALKTYDHMDNVRNWNGVYQIVMAVDDSVVYDFLAEDFSFEQDRYMNAHIDYEEQVTKKSYFNRSYRLPGNQLDMYQKMINNGVIQLRPGVSKKINYWVSDVAGNTKKMTCWVKYDPSIKTPSGQTFNYLLPYDEPNRIETASFYFHLPEGTLYENLYFQYLMSEDRSSDMLSSVHHLHKPKVPLHKYAELGIRPQLRLDSLQRQRAIIAHCNKDNVITSYGGEWQDGMLVTKVRTLGDFSIMLDETPPNVTAKSFRKDLRGRKTFSFTITDNFPTGGYASGLLYEATIDGQWILMEYDAKNDLIFHRFDGSIEPGEHQLRLVVTDDVGNQTVVERGF
ncbi:MAG: M23 family metallopeptidase, partial [Bacteroidota bacterium]